MRLIKSILPAAMLLITLGCGGGSKRSRTEQVYEQFKKDSPSSVDEEPTVNSDTTVAYTEDDERANFNPLSSSAATNIQGDTIRKMIKTADIKFKVKNVLDATYEIEDVARKFGGFVTYTRLESKVDNTTVVPVSPDSSLETVYYTVTNTMTIRIPQAKLDSTLRSFTPMVDYMDHRTIEVQDVHLQLLADQLLRARIKNYQSRVKNNIGSNRKDLGDVNQSEESLLQRQEQADNSLIESLTLKDKIEFSTITLNIYQRQTMKRELIFNAKNIDAYEPGFAYKLQHSFAKGWKVFQAIVLFFVQFWVLYVMALIGFAIYKLVRRKYN